MERRKDPKGRDTPEKRTMLEEECLGVTEDPLRGVLIGAVRSGTLGDPPEPRGIRRRSPWSSTENPQHPRRAMSQWSVRVVRCASTRTAVFVRQRRGAASAASVRRGLDRARTASRASHRLGCVVCFASHRLTRSLRRSRGVAWHLRTRIHPGLFGFDPGLKGKRSGSTVPLKRKRTRGKEGRGPTRPSAWRWRGARCGWLQRRSMGRMEEQDG